MFWIVRVEFEEIENEMIISRIIRLRQIDTDVEKRVLHAGPEGVLCLPVDGESLQLNPGEFLWRESNAGGDLFSCSGASVGDSRGCPGCGVLV